MITSKNYYATIATIDRSKLHPDLQETAQFVDEVTNNGSSWDLYEQEKDIRETIDLFFEKIEAYVQDNKVHPTQKEAAVSKPKTGTRKIVKGNAKQAGKPRMRVVSRPGKPVERISEELKFIKRFVLLNGKHKTKDQIRLFINALQRAITEKRVRKTSIYAPEIKHIQEVLIRLYDQFIKSRVSVVEVSIPQDILGRYAGLVGKEAILQSVRFLKSYIGLQGKLVSNERIKNLHNRIAKAINNEQIKESDPYWDAVQTMLENLQSFVKKNKGEGELRIPSRELNGLDGLPMTYEDYEETQNRAPQNTIMNSMDFVQLQFDKIGFTGKWRDFIGNPSPGFSVLVSAPPKFGKSILCTEWAGYLARNHGRVLYVAREEGLDDTLKEKLKSVAHPNLIVSDYLPDDLSDYDFVFLDSITRLRLSPDDVNSIKENHPDTSFIFVSQVTKSGKARGSNEFAHDVDALVEFPERGHAIQNGRFNQGGEMQVFDNSINYN